MAELWVKVQVGTAEGIGQLFRKQVSLEGTPAVGDSMMIGYNAKDPEPEGAISALVDRVWWDRWGTVNVELRRFVRGDADGVAGTIGLLHADSWQEYGS